MADTNDQETNGNPTQVPIFSTRARLEDPTSKIMEYQNTEMRIVKDREMRFVR